MTDEADSSRREKERLARIGGASPLLAHQLCNTVNGVSAAVQLLEHLLCSANPSIAQAMLTVCDLKKEVRQLTALLNRVQKHRRAAEVGAGSPRRGAAL